MGLVGMAAGLLGIVGAASAQDPVVVGPEIYSMKFENERVRVSEIHFAPGASIPMHEHPDHFLYVLTAGTIQLSYPDGRTADFVAQPGQIVWTPAESHAAVNTGTTDFTALVVELKPLPAYTTGQ
jgi:quercetin dioxygenase-like cupin family protein